MIRYVDHFVQLITSIIVMVLAKLNITSPICSLKNLSVSTYVFYVVNGGNCCNY